MSPARPVFDCITLETPNSLRPLMQEWRESTPLQQRRIGLRNREQLSRFLYKYRGFGGDYAERNLRDMIVHSVLRLSSPSTFNDPYEMCVHVVVEGTQEQRLERFRQIAAERTASLPAAQQAAVVQRLMERPDAEHVKQCQASLAGIRQRAGVFCFAGDPRSVLMWSHYAENHQGVCLQFERLKDFLTLGHAVRVDYRHDLPVSNWIVGFYESIRAILLAKHPSWQYEHERRITSIDNANRYLQLRPDALTGIIFGCRIQRDRMQFIDRLLAEREALGAPRVETYLATQHMTKYKVVISKRARYQKDGRSKVWV